MQVLIDYRKDLPIIENVRYLLGISYFSYNMPEVYELNELVEIVKQLKNKNNVVIVNLEKIMYDKDLVLLLPILKVLEEINVDYITYSDLGVYQLIKDENISLKVIYHASTLITNLCDVKLMLEENDNIILGKEISFQELKKIDSGISENVFIDAFGKFPIFYSRRRLLSTYLEYRKNDVNPKDSDYSLVEEFRSEDYPIVESDGTIVYEHSYYALASELKELNHIESVYLSSNLIDLDKYLKVVNLYLSNEATDENLSKIVPIYKGKLTEKTILIKGGIN